MGGVREILRGLVFEICSDLNGLWRRSYGCNGGESFHDAAILSNAVTWFGNFEGFGGQMVVITISAIFGSRFRTISIATAGRMIFIMLD